MTLSNDICHAAQADRVEWRHHALERLLERGITREEVKACLQNGTALEVYSGDKPFPSLLVAGSVGNRFLHVVAAYDKRTMICYIITAYEPDTEHFEEDRVTRRRSDHG